MNTDLACNPHYDDSYFAWQNSNGALMANIERWKFSPFVGLNDVVLDFGCGGGYILGGLACRERYGVEVNAAARIEAARVIKVHAAPNEIPDDIAFDVVISHHALEHVDNPLRELEELKSRVKPGGKMVFVVPSEIWPKQREYRPGDISQHLYTWTPLNLGNLFTRAGLIVERSELLMHRALPKTPIVYPLVPDRVYHLLCRLWAWVTRTRQVRIVASKPI
jgi:SAM-dependent methyltransferase